MANYKQLVLLVFLLSLNVFGNSFKVGTGSQFNLKMEKGGNADLNIYITESTFTSLSVEYFFFANLGIVQHKMWQQFQFQIKANSPIELKNGYVKNADMTAPEKLTPDYFKVNTGVQVNDFLFSKAEEIEKLKIGVEKIRIPAGSIKASHYRQSNNGQTVDFWISDQAKPIGLVKLISKNEKNPDHNYTIELKTLMKNVKAGIDPSAAVPLTDKGRAALAKPVK